MSAPLGREISRGSAVRLWGTACFADKTVMDPQDKSVTEFVDRVGDKIGVRKTPRRVLEASCAILHEGHFEMARIRQIGEGGLLLCTLRKFQKGDSLVITLGIPGGGVFSTRIEILYDRAGGRDSAYQFGAQFKDLPLKAKRWIRSYVAAKTQKEAEQRLAS